MTSDSDSFRQQYDALRLGRGLFELLDWSSVTISGADRQSFLNSFCTNDVKRLVPGESCEAFITNVKGKILGHGLVICHDEELVVFGTPNQSHPLIAHFDRYVIREDVQLRDTTTERRFLLIAGDDGKPTNAAISWNLVGNQSAGLLESTPDDMPTWLDSFRERGFVVASPQAFTAARIEGGMPLFGIDFDEQNFPQEVDRDREAISFTKGCYLGQETVARIDALGHVNRQLAAIRFFNERVPDSGMELSYDGKKAGQTTSATFSPQLNAPLALAMLRREATAPGTRLESSNGSCQVVSLPIAACNR